MKKLPRTTTPSRAVATGIAASLLALSGPANAEAVPGGTLDPNSVPKYVTPLIIPPVLFDDGGNPTTLEVSLRQFSQQVLPATGCIAAQAANPGLVCNGDAFPATTLWGYGDPERPGSVTEGGTYNNPAFTIEVTKDAMTTMKWVNELVDGNGDFLPHIIRDGNGNPIIDQTLHWAAPNQQCWNELPGTATDCRGTSTDPYLGPVPMVMHVHGAHVGPGSDGYPEAWWLPAAGNVDCTNVPGYPATEVTTDDYACNGTFFESANGADTANALGQGYALDMYPNDQPTTTLWYHDHSLGITRLNVYATSAGFWLIRDQHDGETGLLNGTLPGPAPVEGDSVAALNTPGNPVRSAIREIPIAIQPKSFNVDGSQFYPADRAFFEGLGDGQTFSLNTDVNIPFLGGGVSSDIAPIWNPESFFNTMVVNGVSWPVLEVAPERYRLRLLNAADSRFMNLALFLVNGEGRKLREMPFYQIGAEQGLLPQVVRIETGFATPLPGDGSDVNLDRPTCVKKNGKAVKNCVPAQPGTFDEQALLMGPAERADVIVDFSGREDGDMIIMVNTGPDTPFGGFPDTPADPATSGQVMMFRVNSALTPIDPATGEPRVDPSTAAPMLALDPNPGGEPKLGGHTGFQDLALLEEESAEICVEFSMTGAIRQVGGSLPPDCAEGGMPFGPKAAVIGVNGSGGGEVQLWDDPIQQNPALDAIELWEMWNWSADAHPMHLHLVKFEVVDRQIFDVASGELQVLRDAEPWEAGWKDTVIAYPGEVTRVKAKFDIPGLYVWHCHILSHEDNEMMVPFCVKDADGSNNSCPSELF